MRIVSLSVRLFANILAGHMLILFMGGGLAVLLGLAALGWLTAPMAIVFFLFEVVPGRRPSRPSSSQRLHPSISAKQSPRVTNKEDPCLS